MFELEVQKEAKSSAYLLHMFHMRSYIEFDIRQIVDTSESGSSEAYHAPNDELFSKEDIHYFCNFFTGFLLGYAEAITQAIRKVFME
ncbi:hypothetical protein [Caedibacter taeniospiralis]|uniref:hypothetical protein n=1 Tax=Caedibacter taeniospiralis TaxID=28907 RepID=UPI000C26E177|nr:hypothetical protein [Caedibacter taeniospiralis]